MRLAICSDIHDNVWRLEKALPGMSVANALIFCGDLCAPFTLMQLGRGFDGPVHAVYGNNDGDKIALVRVAEDAGNITLHGDFATLEIGGLKIAVNHYPEMAEILALSGEFDAVFYGHDHAPEVKTLRNGALLVNPGEIMGRKGPSTYALMDTETREVEIVEV
jgi:hypothetical protein